MSRTRRWVVVSIDADAAAAPVGDIQVTLVPAERSGVRVLANGNHRFEGERLGVQLPDLVVALVADVELAGRRMDSDAGEKHGAADLPPSVSLRCGRGFAVGVVEHMHRGPNRRRRRKSAGRCD